MVDCPVEDAEVHRRQVFEVDEILRHILFLVTDGSSADRPTLHAAAQVNSLWAAVALDALWSEVSLQDWYRFMGVTCGINYSPRSCTREAPSAHQYTASARRFDEFYAPRIRRLRLDFSRTDGVALDVCQHLLDPLSSFSSFNLSNLARLDIIADVRHRRLELLRKFLPPRPCFTSFTLRSFASLQQLEEVLDFLPSMQTLTRFCVGDLIATRNQTELIKTLCACQSLTEVVLPAYALSPGHVFALAENIALRRVECSKDMSAGNNDMWHVMSGNRWTTWGRDVFLAPPPSVDRALARLSYIAVSTSAQNAVTMLTSSVDPLVLTSFEINLVDDASSEDIRLLCQTLAERVPRLQLFRLAQGYVSHMAALSWRDLRPLCACAAMEELELFFDGPLDISNTDVEEIASSWKNLRALLLRPMSSNRPRHPHEWPDATLSLDCLVPLAQRCPSLQRLSLRLSLMLSELSAAQVPAGPHKAMMFPDMCVVTFDLAAPNPAYEEVDKLARFFDAAFPRKCVVGCSWLPVYLRSLQVDLEWAAYSMHYVRSEVIEGVWGAINVILSRA